jgi:hypothetical protein
MTNSIERLVVASSEWCYITIRRFKAFPLNADHFRIEFWLCANGRNQPWPTIVPAARFSERIDHMDQVVVAYLILQPSGKSDTDGTLC